MNVGQTIFSQVMDFVPKHEFQKCVQRYRGNYKVKSFSCWDQFLCMAFAQFCYRESLRDVEACLRAMQKKLYHMGFRGRVSRNTLAHANEKRSWKIYADFAQILIAQTRELYLHEPFGVELDHTVYALDASTIDLCLSVFPWAHFMKTKRSTKGAIKLHTLLDLRGSIPTFLHISNGKYHDARVLDEFAPEPAAFYVMDRGYIHFERLYHLHQHHAYFVIRSRNNLRFHRRASFPIDQSTGLICDQTILLAGHHTAQNYPERLRRIRFRDPETLKQFTFLTNHFSVPAFTITELYRCRWKVELFFRWIKQHLRIKAFYGTSFNAVKTQIWIAISVYVLVALIRKRLSLKPNLYTILQILSVSLFEKTELFQTLSNAQQLNDTQQDHNQLILFE